MALLVLFFSLCSSSKAEAPIVEHQIGDDQWVEVPLDFTFPFYGNSYVTSFMFTNGVVGFLDPLDVPGSGYVYDGLCCSGQDFSSGATGHKFTMNLVSFKYTPETAADVSYVNTNSICGYSDWALNTEKDITACFSSTIPANKTFLNIYKLVGNNLYLGFGTASYPNSVNNEKSYIKQ